MLSLGSLLNTEWYKSSDGREILNLVLQRNKQEQKIFGLLEKPIAPPHIAITDVKYKILLLGKGGVGKTSTIARLTGNKVPLSHCETPGMQSTTLYWPGKINHVNKVMMFNLQLWDTSESAMKKYDHIQSACTENLDCIIFVFSFLDKSSFDDVPQQMAKISTPKDNTCKLVIGTKFDQQAVSEIPQKSIRDFEKTWRIPVLKIANINDGEDSFARVAGILGIICEHLWHRDLRLGSQKLTQDGT